jgi:hypothetical protein
VFVKVHRNKGFWVGASLCFGALLTLFLVAQTTGEAYGKKVIRLGADPDVASVGDTITLIAGVSDKAQGKTVLFVVESGSATLSATSAQTDADGWATITATITGAGSITFKASSTGYGSDSKVVMADVYIVIVYCYNPCTLGAKEEILYADGEKTTTVTAQVTGGGGQPLKDVEVTFTVVGGGAANPVKVKTGDDGQATTTITAATLDGVKTRSSISTVKATAGGNDPATATIYMFRSRTTPGPPEVKFFSF